MKTTRERIQELFSTSSISSKSLEWKRFKQQLKGHLKDIAEICDEATCEYQCGTIDETTLCFILGFGITNGVVSVLDDLAILAQDVKTRPAKTCFLFNVAARHELPNTIACAEAIKDVYSEKWFEVLSKLVKDVENSGWKKNKKQSK